MTKRTSGNVASKRGQKSHKRVVVCQEKPRVGSRNGLFRLPVSWNDVGGYVHSRYEQLRLLNNQYPNQVAETLEKLIRSERNGISTSCKVFSFVEEPLNIAISHGPGTVPKGNTNPSVAMELKESKHDESVSCANDLKRPRGRPRKESFAIKPEEDTRSNTLITYFIKTEETPAANFPPSLDPSVT